MPGLIDAHTHVFGTSENLETRRSEPPLYKSLAYKQNLEKILQAGFTTVRDAAGAHWSLRQAVEDGLIKGPRLQICCAALGVTGGHADQNQWGETLVPSDTDRLFKESRICDGADDCRKAAREQFRAGADFIKIYGTGGCASPSDEPWHLQFSEGEIRAIVEEANARGKYVSAHCEEDFGARRCIEFGVRTIEHGLFLSEGTAALMKEKSAYLVTTFSIIWVIQTFGKEANIAEWFLRKVNEPRGPGQPSAMEGQIMGMRNAIEAGVPVGSGSDYITSTMFGSEAMELKLKVDYAALKPYEAIKSATIVNAEICRLKDKTGSIEPGKWADIIVAAGNPDEDINALVETSNIKLVMKRGEVFKNTLS
jgi:imidazolonepropionase-like amidohydrolase